MEMLYHKSEDECRREAAECRQKAEVATAAEMRVRWLALAHDWEALARSIEVSRF
jgi:hypothetical protein